jgi:uncharacterized coiled-coil DUF342 family protein
MTNDLASIVDEQEKEIERLRAELAVVRRDWQADVGTLTARAQTAEARAARTEWERAEAREQAQEQRGWANYYWGEWQNSEKRISQYRAAARNVATSHRELWALYKEACHDNGESIKYNWEMGRQRDAARAEVARLNDMVEYLKIAANREAGFAQALAEQAAADRAAREWLDKMLAVSPVRGETLEPKRGGGK